MLNVFRLTTSSLEGELAQDAGTAGDFVAVLQRQAESMSRLVDDLLDVARIDAGSLRVVRSGCDVSTLAQDALLAVQPLAKQKGITLEAHLPEPSVPVHCDRRRVLQVFANLLGNAVKFTGQGGIRLEVSVEGPEVRFSISDTGAGIPAEHLPHLFERYWQGRDGERSGAGLGLYIAQGIIEAHGGRIWADSTRGKGTRISFTLLRAQPAQPR
jgi:signal transduction histidine kinase